MEERETETDIKRDIWRERGREKREILVNYDFSIFPNYVHGKSKRKTLFPEFDTFPKLNFQKKI